MTTTTLATPATRSGGDGSRRRFARRNSLRRGTDLVIAIVLVAVVLFPIYWMVNVSLQPAAHAVDTPWFPIHPDLNGYVTAIQQQGGHLATSLIIAVGSVILSLLIATPAAYAVAQFKIKGIGIFLFAVLITQMIPGIVVANAMYTLYNQIGLLNTIPGLILADSTAGIPFAILILRAFMSSIPTSVIEAARVDGAGQIRTFFSIVLPMSRNGLITAALFTFLFTWSDFLFALTLTTTDDVRPVTLGLYSYFGSYVSDWSAVMATAALASIPAIILLAVAQRYVAAGTTGGAVK